METTNNMRENMAAPEPAVCKICPRHCQLLAGQIGFCGARGGTGQTVKCISYGIVTSLALDPIEKKPLYHFHPGSKILSAGSFGCNLNCLFCQNYTIARCLEPAGSYPRLTPAELVAQAKQLRADGNIGLAFTYNEPLVGFEFVRDTAKLAKQEGLATVLVTNGYCTPQVLETLLDTIDAFNIDLKCFHTQGYRQLGGELETVKQTIRLAAARRHVEVTTLVVPGLSDSEEAMEEQVAWLADISPEIPLHISRYFPRWQMDAPPTPLDTIRRLEAIARRRLQNVYVGNC